MTNDPPRKILPALLAMCLCVSVAAPQEDREAVRRAYETVRPSLLGIEVTLRKKTRLEKTELEEDGLESEARQLLQLADNRQTYDLWGVAVERDLILIPDRSIDAADIERIEAVDASGARFEARFHAVGRNHDFVLLKPATPRDLSPIAFGDWQAPALGEYFHIVTAEPVDGRWQMNVSPYIQTNAPLVDARDWFCADSLRTGSVVCNAKGAPVGVALDRHLWVRADGRSSFLGRAILADERIADLEEKHAAFRRDLPASVFRVEISLRAERAPEFAPPEDGKAGRLTLFGVAIDDRGTLFIPQDLSREVVRKIEDVRVVAPDGPRAASFIGTFRAFGGALVRAEGLAAGPPAARDARPPAPGELFFTAAFDERSGRNRMRLGYNRTFRLEKGLRGRLLPQPRQAIRPGAFLLDFDGRVIGCATTDRKEEDFDEVAAEAGRDRFLDRYRSGFTPDYLRRLLYFSEIADALAAPAAHLDPRAIPMSKREEKRLVWLGVEYQEVSKPIAEALGLLERDLTHDGRRGLVVTAVYPGSPAARAGLREDDVLLAVQPKGDATARDLIAEPERFAGLRRSPFDPRALAPPWKPTRNYLTSVLTEIGAGRAVLLDYVRGKQKAQAEVALEYAPTDYETAEKARDDALGITVKDLTYEVRYYNRLDEDVTGVVVAKVESGGRADVAKLGVLSIISRVNDVKVRDLAHFRELLGASKTATLTALSHGQTRLVELSRE